MAARKSNWFVAAGAAALLTSVLVLVATGMSQPANQPADKKPAQPTGDKPAPKPEAPPEKQPAKPTDEKKPAKPGEEKKAEEPEALPKPVTLPSGVIVEDLKLGKGTECHKNDGVQAHYRGTLKADGTEFDSSYKRNKPLVYSLAFLIKGWQEGIPGMREGGKRRLTIPYALAYGEKGRPGIPPKADLVFELELLKVVQVEDIKVGDGVEARPDSTIKAFYKGTFKADGKQFETNVGEEALTASLRPGLSNSVIDGWQAGIPGMKVGGKRKLTIPWEMAYGERGSGKIPPKADLVFEIELVEVK